MITLQDLIDTFGEDEIIQRSDKNRDKKIDEVVVNKAIQASINKASGYLRSVGLIKTENGQIVYAYPNVPLDLTQNLADIARYYLYDKVTTPTIDKRYDEAIAWLKSVQKNPKMLTGIDDDENNATTDYQSSTIHVMPNPVPSIYDL